MKEDRFNPSLISNLRLLTPVWYVSLSHSPLPLPLPTYPHLVPLYPISHLTYPFPVPFNLFTFPRTPLPFPASPTFFFLIDLRAIRMLLTNILFQCASFYNHPQAYLHSNIPTPIPSKSILL